LLGHLEGLALARAPPGVDLRLQLVAARQEGGVARREVRQDRLQRRPELVGREPGPRQQLLAHEACKDVVDRKLVHGRLALLGPRAQLARRPKKRKAPAVGREPSLLGPVRAQANWFMVLCAPPAFSAASP